MFEECEKDLPDLYAIEKALQMFNRFCSQLKNEQLTWTQFHKLSEKLVKEIKVNFEEEELTWSIDEILPLLIKNIEQQRYEKSSIWINDIKKEHALILTMLTTEANHLHSKAIKPPPFITEHDIKDLSKIITQIEEHLNKLAIEWLIKKYRELPYTAKTNFLEVAKQILEKNSLRRI
jgi:transcriptional regulator of heat shock response